VGSFAQRGRAGQFEHFRDGLGRKRAPTGFTGFVVQKANYALLAISLLPTPDGGATDPGPPRDLQHGQSFGGTQDNLGPLNVLQGAIAISHDGKQSLAIFGMGQDIGDLGHDPRFAYLATPVNQNFTSKGIPREAGWYTVGIKLQQEGEHSEQRRHHKFAVVAVLKVSGVHDGADQQALRVDEDMALLARVLPRRIAAPPFSALLTL